MYICAIDLKSRCNPYLAASLPRHRISLASDRIDRDVDGFKVYIIW